MAFCDLLYTFHIQSTNVSVLYNLDILYTSSEVERSHPVCLGDQSNRELYRAGGGRRDCGGFPADGIPQLAMWPHQPIADQGGRHGWRPPAEVVRGDCQLQHPPGGYQLWKRQSR